MGYHPEVLERVRQLNIIDDVLFQKMAESKDFCSELISTVMGKAVTVLKTIPQDSIKNLQGRSVVLDALCETENRKLINVEVQKANDDDHIKRVRYNSSCITANITDPGSKFEKVPDLCMIFISKFDMFQCSKTVYHINRIIEETGKHVDNGLIEIYVNTKVNDESDLAELMRLFTDKDAYNFKKFPITSKRKKQFKMTEEGEKTMCDIVEEYANKKAQEATKTAIRKMIKRGYPLEEILEIYPETTEQEIEELKCDL